MARLVGLTLVVAALIGCRTAPKREGQLQPAQITLSTTDSSQSSSTSPNDNCGLDDFPVSKSTKDILAAVPRDNGRPPNQMMLAKVAIDPAGKVTHLRVLRLAWPNLSNSYAINAQAVDSIKRWHHTPTTIGGKAVAVCSEVSVIIDLQ